jgi:hypothetical protein
MSMERTEVLDMMGELKLFGMKGAYDETPATAIKRKHDRNALSAICSRPRSRKSRRARSDTS